ncbi:transposase [Skermanella sp. TT6]|uniref:Transposase n=1 Tax=Skermanella cutis TaxID=2775420 RepID=A0ABX7BDA4_9PROT|nr:transposase [Skermanella sp. TT6]QQP91233.1 transposase [Skermanella sp. TT6]
MLNTPASPLPDDVTALRTLVAELNVRLAERDQAVTARDHIIETLKAQLATLRRRHFGQSSERLADQLELQIEELEQCQGATAVPAAAPVAEDPGSGKAGAERARPVRRPLPANLPREEEVLAPPYARCPSCQVDLHRIGEDVSV